MKPRAHARSLALLFVLGAFRPLPADTILLRNGNRIQGEIIEEDSRGITVRFFGGTLHIKARDVVSVERESRLQYFLEQGESFLRHGEGDLAVEAYRKACAANPGSEPARKGLTTSLERRAEALEAKGLYRRSTSAWRELLSEVPDHPRARPAIDRIAATLKGGEAEEEEAARALKEGSFDEAVRRLRSIYQRFPERQGEVGPLLARALVEEAHRHFKSREAERAEECYLEALGLEPDLLPVVSARFAWVRAIRLQPLLARGDFKELLLGAEEGLRVAPGNEALSYLAGIAQEGLGRRAEAAESYRIAAGLPRGASRSAETLRKAAEAKLRLSSETEASSDPSCAQVLPGNYREIETENFVVRHRNESVGGNASEAAEAAYRVMHKEMGLKGDWRKRCTINIFPTKEEFTKLPNHAGWTGGFYQRRAHEIFAYQTDPRLASATIPHEIGHAMLYFALEGRDRVPLWFNEGFAIHWEPSFTHRNYRRILDRAASGGAGIPASRLLSMKEYPSDEGTAAIFYAESHFLVELLIEEKGMEVLLKFAGRLAEDPESLDVLLDRFYRIRGVRGLENRLSARLSL